jgi:poly(hydroxyalkanoate) depolymerase family esterase
MVKSRASPNWSKTLGRGLAAAGRRAMKQGQRLLARATRDTLAQMAPRPTKARSATRPTPSTPGGRGHWLDGQVIAKAGVRRWQLYLPSLAASAHGGGLPVLLMLHGCGQDADEFARSTRMPALADRAGCAVLLVEQDRLAHPQRCWRWWDTRQGRAQREADILLQALDEAGTRGPIDLARVAVAGLSAGAGMAALLAQHAPERFCAVVMHSGVPPGLADSTLSALAAMRGQARLEVRPAVPAARAGAWPALLVIHGDADRVVSIRNAHLAVERWAQQGGASAQATRRLQRGQRHPVSLTDYRAGRRLVATLATVHGLGHAWSGGSAALAHGDPHGPDAGRLLWRFVAAQFARVHHATSAP